MIAGMALVLSLVIGEAALRAVVKLPLRRILPEVKYTPHAVRRFTLLPSQEAFSYGAPVRIDSRAFRITSDEPTSGQRADVLALGDSFTFGMGVRDEETWPARLQHLLSASAGRRVGVVNAGTISYGVFQELDLLRSSGLATRPRVVVHALYWNDFMNASAPKPDAPAVVDANGYLAWDQLGQSRGLLRRVTSRAVSSSALLFTLREAAAASARSGTEATSYGAAYARFLEEGLTSQEWQPVEDFYRQVQSLAAEHDFTLVAVVMPVSGIVTGHTAPHTHPYPAAARELLERLDIPYLDAFQLWSGRPDGADYFLPQGADAHLNPDGYRLVTDALAKTLLGETSVRALFSP